LRSGRRKAWQPEPSCRTLIAVAVRVVRQASRPLSRLPVAFWLLAGIAGCASAQNARMLADERVAVALPTFANEDQKLLACLDLRDHIVDLYANQYVVREGLAMSPAEGVAFRDGWAEQLAKRGTFERFEQSCFVTLTPRKYECGMASQSTDGLVACMKLSAR
jgi:hypothetical protein